MHPSALCRRAVCAVFTVILSMAAGATGTGPGWQLKASYPHVTRAFTQGLLLYEGDVLESSGLYQRSFISRWQLDPPEQKRRQRFKRDVFGEGLTVLDNRLYTVTWRAGLGFIHEPDTLRPLGQFTYRGEGWGLTDNGQVLILSDGTATLRFIEPGSWKTVRELTVTEDGRALKFLNELEWVAGKIYANIWRSPHIVVIDANTGKVEKRLDLSALVDKARPAGCRECVLNGIAHDPSDNSFLVTGKRWPTVFRITLQ